MEPELKLINMDKVEVEQIEWLFYPFIPYGKVTIIQGDPGEGKTTMVLQIIAKLTTFVYVARKVCVYSVWDFIYYYNVLGVKG